MSIFKKAIIIFASVVFVAVFLCYLTFYIVMGSDYVARGESVSINEATNVIGFPLVSSATNISYYWVVGGLQSSEFYMRVTVVSRDITNQINLVMADNNHTNNFTLPYIRTKIDSSEPIPKPSVHWWNKQIYWWTPDKITNGYHINSEKSGAHDIWVDENSGTLFISTTD